MHHKKISIRIRQLIAQSEIVLSSRRTNSFINGIYVDSGKLAGLRASVLSFIAMVFGKEHSHYSEFEKATSDNLESSAKKGYGILLAIQDEIDGGWIFSVKKLVSAEIFSDFLEMAEHLLEQDYKDPAAVMIGSVLEENLRQLCHSIGVETEIEKEDGIFIPKSADRINSDLAKAGIYTKLDQKSVTAWLDLRNKAAHGKYREYEKEQVVLMMQGVTDFLARMTAK
ncbi:MAG: hypothetical protein E6Q60_00190 [Nitrosomonas oligotropha]|uniref:DUF4145 domain-containing protein n=1 Tax=Nitrosomonas oligotropha TaxID=42354 RepID=A0A5C7VZB5_9PROT|nr:MAG: hypothetical protein E6Q60_00190 [Nitrosomonas oligotropha]